MANATAGSVIVVDTTGYTGVGSANIEAIKYIGAASGTATIKDGGSGGVTVWEQGGTANVTDTVEMRISDLYVTLTNSAKIYIYLCAE